MAPAMNRRNNKPRNIKVKARISFKERFTEILELPKEVALNFPKIIMVGNRSFIIENHRGIAEYENNSIAVKYLKGTVRIQGMDLFIKEITSENISIEGKISSLAFIE